MDNAMYLIMMGIGSNIFRKIVSKDILHIFNRLAIGSRHSMIQRKLQIILIALLFTKCPGILAGAPIPNVELSEVRSVEWDGSHNAFTDLAWFRGRIYLTIRSCPDGHMVHPTSIIKVLSSSDGDSWREDYSFSVPDRDTRDPHFVKLGDKLFIYSGTWYWGEHRPNIRNMNQMLGYGVSTTDGKHWTQPFQLNGTYGHYVWRGAAYDGAIYLCARRRRNFTEITDLSKHTPLVESRFLKSDDGVSFRDVGFFQSEYGDETAFSFEPNGAIHAVSRRGGGKTAQLIQLNPPYTKPEHTDLGRYIGGPMVFSYGEHSLVAGRNIRNGKALTNVSVLRDGKLVDLIDLPSGGDCSYPGMVTLCPGCILVSWYSSHLKDEQDRPKTTVFTAKLSFN